VSYPVGLYLAALSEAIAAAREDGAEILPAVKAFIRVAHRIARPVAWWGRIPARLRPNPFRSLTAAEIGAMIALFFVALTRSSVQSVPRTALGSPSI
jgi:hypothetical protein